MQLLAPPWSRASNETLQQQTTVLQTLLHMNMENKTLVYGVDFKTVQYVT
jgi:hypothetical protein